MLPIKLKHTTKIAIGQRAYERIDSAMSVSLIQSKEFEYRDYIDSMLPYNHIVPAEWVIWKILSEVAIRDKIFVRGISYPAWGKTSTFYVLNQLRNDIEIVDGGTFAKLKHSLSVQPSVLVLDEVDDLSTDERRFLAKLIRSCGDGRGKVNNDSRAVNGTSEVFDLTKTSLIALYNFPTQEKMSFFENNFHDKILDRMFPVLLNGGSAEISPMIQKHPKIMEPMTEQEKLELDKFLKTSLYFEDNFLPELGDKRQWKCQYAIGRKRWDTIYLAVCDGIKLYAKDEEEFQKLEKIFYQMHTNYLEYKQQYNRGNLIWNSIKDKKSGDINQMELN
jgi:hypothetical protein